MEAPKLSVNDLVRALKAVDDRNEAPKKASVPSWTLHMQSVKPGTLLKVTGVNKRQVKERGIHQALYGFPTPASVVIRSRYAEAFGFTATSGAVQYYQWRWDCYDPNLTGTGAQPAGFDQWMAFYEKYRVHGCKTKISFMGIGASAAATTEGLHHAMAYLSTGDYLTGSENVIDVAMMPFGHYRLGGPTGSPPTEYTIPFVRTATVLGMSPDEFIGRDDTAGTSSGVASLYATSSTIWQPILASNTVVIRGVIELEFEVEFFDRKKLIAS